MEVIWTGILSFVNKDKRMMGNTSVIMFPIYGMASFLKPIIRFVKNKNFLVRGTVYTLCIYLGEYLSGSILKKRNMCPWDYSKSKFNIKGLIRLDFLPVWFGTGLLFEKILKKQ